MVKFGYPYLQAIRGSRRAVARLTSNPRLLR
jgi:hypothetical protein